MQLRELFPEAEITLQRFGEYDGIVAALRAELDAAKAANAALEAQRDEARELVWRSMSEVGQVAFHDARYDALFRWASERAALPVTNRDVGDESGAA